MIRYTIIYKELNKEITFTGQSDDTEEVRNVLDMIDDLKAERAEQSEEAKPTYKRYVIRFCLDGVYFTGGGVSENVERAQTFSSRDSAINEVQKCGYILTNKCVDECRADVLKNTTSKGVYPAHPHVWIEALT